MIFRFRGKDLRCGTGFENPTQNDPQPAEADGLPKGLAQTAPLEETAFEVEFEGVEFLLNLLQLRLNVVGSLAVLLQLRSDLLEFVPALLVLPNLRVAFLEFEQRSLDGRDRCS